MNLPIKNQIEALNVQIRELTGLVLNQVQRAADAAATGNAVAADIVAVNVEQVNHLLSRIEDECLNILPLCSQTAADLRSVFDVARVNRELARISSLARVIAHQAGILAPGGLPATARDITLMADLAAAACARAVRAVLAQNAGDAHATGEERAMIDGIRDRLSTRFEEALQQPGRQVHALLAGLTVVASLVQIGDHTTRIARVVTGL